MTHAVQFPNLRSRLLLGRLFQRQYVLPEPPPRLLVALVKWYERLVLNIDLTDVRIDRPIFLVGLPRSGTSMLQNILCAHPQIAYITNTMNIFRSCLCGIEQLRKRLHLNARGERYLGDSVEVDAGSPADAVAFWGQWLHEHPTSLAYSEHCAANFAPQEIEDMCNDIRRILWCFGDGPRRFFTKNPGLLPKVTLLQELFPDARFIHIVRDPRMTANSMLKLYRRDNEQLSRLRGRRQHAILGSEPFIPYPRLPRLREYIDRYGVDDIHTTSHVWNDAISLINKQREQLAAFCEVRYEDILDRPQQEIARLLAFCELPNPEDDAPLQSQLADVGCIHHENRYGNFQVVESICREHDTLRVPVKDW